MEKIKGLFSLKGRASRRSYWRIQLLLALVFALIWCGGLLLAIATGIGSISGFALAGVALIVVAGWATVVRRLHDRNKSAWWLLVFYALPFAADSVVGLWKISLKRFRCSRRRSFWPRSA